MGSTPTLSLWDQVEGFAWNAATGTLTAAQKAAIEQSQASSVAAASGGTMSAADALGQAHTDVTAVLTQDNADPSQASIFNNPGLDSLFQKAGTVIAVVVALVIAYVGIQLFLALKRGSYA